MSLYKYRVADGNGVLSEITVDAENTDEALNRLRSRNMIPVKFIGVLSDSKNILPAKFLRHDFNALEFTDRLYPMLRAHIPLERALRIIAESYQDSIARQIVNNLRQGLHEGKSFSDLIRNQGAKFPPMYANLLEAGEQTGCIPEVIGELHKYMTDSRELKDFLVTCSIYPLIVLAVTFSVIILLFSVFIPKFSRIFIEMGKELPLPTQIMLGVSNLLTDYWWLWLTIIVAIVIAGIKIANNPEGQFWLDRQALKLPLFGTLIKTVDINRFIKTIAILLNNHVPILDAIEVGRKILQNRVIFESFSSITHELKSGSKLSEALSKSTFIPIDTIQLLKVGEESGNLGSILSQAADDHERRMKVKIKKLLALFEPVVILFLAVIILMVVLSIFLAIFEMNEI